MHNFIFEESEYLMEASTSFDILHLMALISISRKQSEAFSGTK